MKLPESIDICEPTSEAVISTIQNKGEVIRKLKKPKLCGIYKITNPKGKVYIGQSIDIKSRFDGYRRLSKDTRGQILLWRSFEKYGVGKHKFFQWEFEDAAIKKGVYVERANTRRVAVNQLDANRKLVKRWDGINIAQEELRIFNISLACKSGGCYGGCYWEYANEKEILCNKTI